jgi:hypothetical protein
MTDYPELTVPPWPADTKPTAAELLPWFLEQTEEAQVWMIQQWRDDQHAGIMCRVHAHELELGQLRAQVDRLLTENRWLTQHREMAHG